MGLGWGHGGAGKETAPHLLAEAELPGQQQHREAGSHLHRRVHQGPCNASCLGGGPEGQYSHISLIQPDFFSFFLLVALGIESKVYTELHLQSVLNF